ncbi:MAG: AMP-binding protein, partial [Phycisphaerales bacterium]|nr:AMP-binding protein [Phycisphaerales bacterium]
MILEKVILHGVETPNHVAIVDDKRTLTYRELVYAANLFVDHLNELAPVAEFGDKVGLLIPPSSAFVVAYGGTRWADRIAMPLNYLLKPEELVGIVKDSGVKVIITIAFFRKLAETVTAGAGGGVKVVDIESLKFEKPSAMAMAKIAVNPANLRKYLKPLPQRAPDDVAVLLYTSGTSGTPKGVMLTNENLESNAYDSCEHAHFTRKTVFLGNLPMFHAFGLMASVHIPLLLGSKVVFQSRFSPMSVFEAVKKHAVEVLVMVPTMYAVMAGAKNGGAETFKSVQIAISGGEPLPVTLIEQVKAKFGITLMEGFGLTETSPIVAINMPWAYKAGSVGKVIPHVAVKTVDESGHDLAAGVDGGELWI